MARDPARNVQSKGGRLTVYNRTLEKMAPFVAAGASRRTPQEAQRRQILS
jgi:3-hydroxyisobutyrate dehydrogenase-like beta-hydroxyacid dehydrogenase